MTPQEKAKELVDKYWKYSTYAIQDSAIKCALIAVDEIIKVCNEEISNCSDMTYFYWQEVKQAIDKL